MICESVGFGFLLTSAIESTYRLSGAIILSIAYGLEVRDVDDP